VEGEKKKRGKKSQKRMSAANTFGRGRRKRVAANPSSIFRPLQRNGKKVRDSLIRNLNRRVEDVKGKGQAALLISFFLPQKLKGKGRGKPGEELPASR